MIRILMTADAVGGVWTYAMELCRALEPHGAEIFLATMGALPTMEQQRQARALSNVTLHTSTFKLEWMAEPWDDVRRAGDWLANLEDVCRPDVVHLNGFVHAALPWRAPVLVAAHSCVLSWWAAVKREPLPDHWLNYAANVSRGLRSADHIVAPSQAMLDCLSTHYHDLPHSCVIHNGRSQNPFSIGLKNNFILTAGRLWDEAKNVGALNAIADRLPWPVLVAGDTAAGAQPTRVQSLGQLSEIQLAEKMSHAAIYASPARYEPFGLSVLEAALSGCALVLGDIPSLRELWGETAVFVPPEDNDALTTELCNLVSNPRLRRERARRALNHARRYGPQQMAEKYLSVYQRLIAGSVPTFLAKQGMLGS